MMSKTMIRVICIIMAVLMVLSVGAVVLQVIAADEGAVMSYVSPVTGDSGSDYYVPAGIAVAAILAVVLCLVLPKLKKGTAAESKSVPAKKTENVKKAPDNKPKVRNVGRTVQRDKNIPSK